MNDAVQRPYQNAVEFNSPYKALKKTEQAWVPKLKQLLFELKKLQKMHVITRRF